ncbi:class I SAM-dependent methyltransferase [Microbacterium saperdae]|uniref:Methyltransferase family protein n=1 Tax=Microbacterium saperdae TaxID=69368 RepID=A0A543BLR2_9MICO|nr:class I SAM-dependent methyltransferase [Microbacterium saperdae]TQL85771.1 methyltransferase family protein [Microbacterium saperdae]GGM53145.1 hypothetical protein GCM10010489_25930 [Microbacterium saperdae]
MPAPDVAATAIASALFDLTSGLAAGTSQTEADDAVAPESLQRRLNGGTEAHIGAHYADVVMKDRSLPADARILDLGCGYGRVALDLAERLSDDQRYVGLDPHAEAIEWAQENIGRERPNFRFELIDVVSKPYNPDGELDGARFRFPFEDDSLDRVFMISVLTHVDLATVRNYLEEAARVLKPDTGRLVATIFLLDREVDRLIAAGRSEYRLAWQIGESRVENRENPELVIAHPLDRVLDILHDAGFPDFRVRQGHWSGRPASNVVDFQDMLVADFGTVTAAALSAEEQAEASEHAALAARLVEHGLPAEHLAPYLVWSFSAMINLLRWEKQGIQLLLRGADAGERRPLALARVRDIDFSACIPATAPADAFVPVDEAAILAAVREADPRLARPALVALLGDVVQNGIALETSVREGNAIQRLADSSERPAPIPLPPAAESPVRGWLAGILARFGRH